MTQPIHALPDQDCRYDAFISYRHLPLDHAVAQHLQTLLESYRPPKNLPGLRNKRIQRIFRDQSELPTSSDLGADIQAALLSSRYLIVICSEALRNPSGAWRKSVCSRPPTGGARIGSSLCWYQESPMTYFLKL